MLQAIAARRIVEWPPDGLAQQHIRLAHKFHRWSPPDRFYSPDDISDALRGVEYLPAVMVLRQCKNDKNMSTSAYQMLNANGYTEGELAIYSVVASNHHIAIIEEGADAHDVFAVAMYCGNIKRIKEIIATFPGDIWVFADRELLATMNPKSWNWCTKQTDINTMLERAILAGAGPIRLASVMPKPGNGYTPTSACYSAAAAEASRSGDLITLVWLHKTYGPGWTIAAIYAAAKPASDHKALHYLLLNDCPHPASYDDFLQQVIHADFAYEDFRGNEFDLGTLECAARMFVQALECVRLRKQLDSCVSPSSPGGAAAAAGPA